MKFKKIEINGFKSFADKIDIPLAEGVTAIVGPNGCGKSNVADAIRWALGEQSAKLLRGGSMQDVIFNGTEKRLSHSFCEVSLHFDNSEKIFKDLDYKDVVLTRKLFRSNESEYQINKASCRRTDIIDTLRDSGIGREGYSIIGQGRVDELISSKPEDRRAIFDEAAGISKFKAKKVEAERRLARTRDHLVRISDILTEKSKQLEPLTRQSETARKFLEASELLKNLEINIYLHQYETASDIKKQITDRRDRITAELESVQKEYEKACAAYNEAMQKLNEVDEVLNEKHKRLLELSVGLERNAGEITIAKNSISYLNDSNAKLNEEIIKIEAEIETALSYIKKCDGARPEQSSALADLKSKGKEIEDQLNEIVDKLTGSAIEEKEGHRNLIEAMEKLSEIKSNMSSLIAEKTGLCKRVTELEIRIGRIQNAAGERNKSIISLQQDIEKYKKDIETTSQKLNENGAETSSNLARLSEINGKLSDINAEYFSMSARQKLLNDLKENNSCFEESVTRLLNCAKDDRNVSSRIEGIVARVMTVPKTFENAVETAVGGAMNNIITKTENEAAYLVDYLKKTKLGRVTFLPLSVIRPRKISAELTRYLDINGCYGVASKLVTFDKKFENIVENLLGGTVVVDTIDTAISLAKTVHYAFNIVTLDGDIVKPSGAITGGTRKSRIANLFSNERELRELTDTLAGVKESIDLLEAERDGLVEKQEIARLEHKSLQANAHSLELKFSTIEHQYKRLISERAESEREEGEISGEIMIATNRIKEIDDDVNSVGELERIIQNKKQSASDNTQQRENETEQLRAMREELNDKLLAIKLDIASYENEINNSDQECNRLSENIEANRNKLQLNRSQISVNEADIQRYQQQLDELTTSISASDSQSVAGLKKEIADFSSGKQQLQESITAYDEKRASDLEIINDLQDKRRNEEYQLLKVDTDIEQMQERIADAYKMEYCDCLPFRDEEFAIEKALEDADKLRRRIDRLQPVNLEAIEMCEQVYKEYSELETQRDDLNKAERDLVKMIEDLSKEMRVTFKEKFNTINEHFKHIFRELFDGGNAELILQEEEGVSDLDAGVEIVAQPPQKKLQILSLLSGGEKALTAIAILFAILRLRPMPFCVLDEIEAALDDANALRFSKYLRRFSKDTQFIVITHRKPTMELADSLYGVTMQEKGVSRIVSVKLAEAMQMAN